MSTVAGSAWSQRIHWGQVGVRPLCVLAPTQGRDVVTGRNGSITALDEVTAKQSQTSSDAD